MGGLASKMRSLALEGEDDAPETELSHARGPVILILDDSLQCLPWEGLTGYQKQRCSPSTSLA